MRIEIPEKPWLEELLVYDERVKYLYPMDKRVILINADTTIFDIRHVIPFLLRSFDQKTRMTYLAFLKTAKLGAVDASSDVCRDLPLSFDNKEATLMWYLNNRQRAEAVIDSAKFYARLMDLVRHFESIPDMYVGFVSQRPQSVRNKAVQLIKTICSEYDIHLKEDLLFMAANWYGAPTEAFHAFWKAQFTEARLRVISAIDFKLYRDMMLEQDTPIFTVSKETLFHFFAEETSMPGCRPRK